VLVPKSSFSQRRRRSIEANQREAEEPEEPENQEPAPWVMTEHNKLVPIMQPVNRFNNSNVNNSDGANTSRKAFNNRLQLQDTTNTNTNTNTNGNGNTNTNTNTNGNASVSVNGLSLRKNRLPTPKRAAFDPVSDYIVTGGYVVSSETYYASLPLPDLPPPPPPPRHLEPAPVVGAVTGVNETKRNEIIHDQLRQNAEIVQARRMGEPNYTGRRPANRF
jgi:hypothetical protein